MKADQFIHEAERFYAKKLSTFQKILIKKFEIYLEEKTKADIVAKPIPAQSQQATEPQAKKKVSRRKKSHSSQKKSDT